MNKPTEDTFTDPLENYDTKSYADPIERAIAEEKVGQIQHQPHTSIPSNTTVADAVRKLASEHISCLLVEEDAKLVGVFTDREVLKGVALDREAGSRPVSEVMTTNPVFVYEHDPVAAALCVMAVSGYRHVPVLNANDEIAGIISPQRVTNFLAEHADG